MRSFFWQVALSAAGIVSAQESSLGLDLGFCGSSLGSSLWNPICSADRQTLVVEAGIGDFQDNIHRAVNKPEEVILSSSKSSKNSPWSHTPRCLRMQNATEKYCIYSSSTFAQNRGVALFTTPEHKDLFLKVPAFANPDVTKHANREPNPPYESRQLPGRGVGLIANRTLHRGDHIFSNTPVFIVHGDIYETFADSDRLPFQTQVIQRLPERTNKLFMDLCGHFGGDRVDDIINTNSFAVDLFEDEGEETVYNVMFPEISRLNHDCRPNAHYHFDPETLTQHVHALRTIMPGEELTISYLDPAQTREERLKALKSSWGFDCSCSLCTQPEPQSSASDARIREFPELTEELEDYTKDSLATPEMAELLVSMYQQERLYGPISEPYKFAAIEFNGVGDVWTAQKYARLAVEAGILYGGLWDKDVKSMESLLKDPEGHWSYMLRTTKGIGS